ncbi:MAG TPA: fibronectin type III domain-containing protein, partial [Thermoanaerobaculia bacterium]|nr:fibronectin type III domain-containing protein [Thermoanaerobaculia bacterium]
MKSRPITILFALALLVFGGSAAATSFVMVSDETLVDQATLVVDARVLSTDSAPRAGLPSTDYMIEVDRALSGRLSGRNLIVRVPGGIGPDGFGLALFGMPEFGVGERVVLFLKPRPDGTYGIVHLMLGAFHEVVVDGQALLLRDLSGARELAMPGEQPGRRAEYRQPRAAEPFRRWVEDRARGREREPDYRIEDGPEAGGLSSVTSEFVLFSSRFGNLRWFAFDEGTDVPWFIQSGGQPGYGQSRTATIAAQAMGVWNAVSQTNINYRYAGVTGDTTGFDGCANPSNGCADGLNTIIFGDVDGSHDEPFSCIGGQGGVLAIGGPWFDSRRAEDGPNGLRYHRIPEAEVVTNQGIECFLTSDADLLQLFAHELGHTLGINHTCDPDEGSCTNLQSEALMYPFFHNDERGAALNSDDRSAVRFLYPGSTGAPPAAPSGLAASVLSPSEVELTWNDNSVDETGFFVQGRLSGQGNFTTMATAGVNQETLVVDELDPETAYDFRVQARNGALGSGFSNTVTVTTLSNVPVAPSNLTAAATTDETVFLQWDDLADNEESFVVEMRTPTTADWMVVEDAIEADVTSFFVGGLTTGQPYTFRVLAVNDEGTSNPSEEVAVTPLPAGPSTCVADDETLCLLGDRFEVAVQWRNQMAVDDFGVGNAEMFESSDRTGRFTFFNPNNVELIVKVLDGSGLTGNYWTFYGALSNVEYWI